jgi:hypothetical protein
LVLLSWLARRPQLSGPLASRNFRLLAGCNVISRTGSAIAFVAIPFAVLRAGGSAADIGYVATAELLPLTAVLLLGGVVAGRLPRHQVMAAANALQALAQGTAAILLLAGQAHVWELGVLAAAGGTAFGLYFPAARGLLPQTVPVSQRSPANALCEGAGRHARSLGSPAVERRAPAGRVYCSCLWLPKTMRPSRRRSRASSGSWTRRCAARQSS